MVRFRFSGQCSRILISCPCNFQHYASISWLPKFSSQLLLPYYATFSWVCLLRRGFCANRHYFHFSYDRREKIQLCSVPLNIKILRHEALRRKWKTFQIRLRPVKRTTKVHTTYKTCWAAAVRALFEFLTDKSGTSACKLFYSAARGYIEFKFHSSNSCHDFSNTTCDSFCSQLLTAFSIECILHGQWCRDYFYT